MFFRGGLKGNVPLRSDFPEDAFEPLKLDRLDQVIVESGFLAVSTIVFHPESTQRDSLERLALFGRANQSVAIAIR